MGSGFGVGSAEVVDVHVVVVDDGTGPAVVVVIGHGAGLAVVVVIGKGSGACVVEVVVVFSSQIQIGQLKSRLSSTSQPSRVQGTLQLVTLVSR